MVVSHHEPRGSAVGTWPSMVNGGMNGNWNAKYFRRGHCESSAKPSVRYVPSNCARTGREFTIYDGL